MSRRIRISMLSAASAVLLMGLGQKPSENDIVDVVDIASTINTPPKDEIAWSDKRVFDVDLYRSLDADKDVVTVLVGDEFKRDDYPRRLANWVSKIDEEDRHSCVIDEGEMGLVTVIAAVLPYILQMLTEYAMYSATSGYEVVEILDKQNNVERLVFMPKTAGAFSCPQQPTVPFKTIPYEAD